MEHNANSRIIEIYDELFDGFGEHQYYDEGEIINLLNNDQEIKKYLDIEETRHGDVIHLQALGDYRNDGKFIYDGVKIIGLDYSIDDYGALPGCFNIEKFPHVKYFSKTIDHNRIIHINGKYYNITRKFEINFLNEGKTHLYKVSHVNTLFEWIIISNKTEEDFKKSLFQGTFEYEDDKNIVREIFNVVENFKPEILLRDLL